MALARRKLGSANFCTPAYTNVLPRNARRIRMGQGWARHPPTTPSRGGTRRDPAGPVTLTVLASGRDVAWRYEDVLKCVWIDACDWARPRLRIVVRADLVPYC